MKFDSEKPVNVKVQNDSFILYQPNYKGCKVSVLRNYKLSLVRNKGYNGYLNETAIRKIKNTIQNWYNTINEFNNSALGLKSYSKRKLTFITLTLSAAQKHEDNYIKRHALDRFIVFMRRNHGLKNYIWRAEKQQNGNIHFHIVTDVYIHNKKVQEVWNNIQDALGYIELFYQKFNHKNPPSTDIHVVKDSKELGSYVAKYLTKSDKEIKDDKLIVKGRLYGISDSLRVLKTYTIDTPYDLITYLNDCNTRMINRVFESEYFDIFSCDTSLILDTYFPSYSNNRQKFYIEQYKKLYFYKTSEHPMKSYATPIKKDWFPMQMKLDFTNPYDLPPSSHFNS